MIKAIINTTTYDFHEFKKNQFIIFDQHIIETGNMDEFINKDYKIFQGENFLTLPGLICGHTHIYSAFARGLSLPFDPINFQEILDQLWWKLDRHLDLDMIYHSGIVFGVDFVKNGVTTLIDHHASGVDIKNSLFTLKKAICEDVGLRGIFAFETSDRFPVEKSIKENELFIKSPHHSTTAGLFGLHASMSLSDETLKKVKRVINDDPIHIHVAESVLDEQDALQKYGKRIIHRLNDFGLLNPNSIIAHAIYVDDDELELIKAKDCVIAVNFSSNMNNSVGLPDLKRFRNKGVKVIIGNDGISSSITTEYLALYYATHLKDLTPNDFGLDELLKMIQDTYDYVSHLLKIKIGKIKTDYVSDLLMVPYVAPTPMNASNIMGHLFFGLFNSFKPKFVFVNGTCIVDSYEISNNLSEKYKNASQSAEKLWKNIKNEVNL